MSRRPQMEDWEELGDAISDIIDSAVNSQNYQKLNKTVTDAVSHAVDLGTDAIRRRAEANGHPLRRTDTHVNKNIYSSKISSVSAPQQPRENLPVLYRNTSGKMAGGIAKAVGGGIVTVGSALDLALTTTVSAVLGGTTLFTAGSALLTAFLCGGIWLLASGVRTIGRLERYRKYVTAMGRQTYCSIEQLARSVGKPEKFVRKELPKMIDEGLFLEGHIDQEGTSLITSHETYRYYQQTQKVLEERRRQQALEAKEAERRAAERKVSDEVQEVLDRGNAFIREIRRCNDAIPGEEISAKIFRMEHIVQKIFERAEAHPEIVPDLKKLMNYYLPMTVKLLNAYADMDAQPVQGETIQASKREIEATLDTLNLAFEKLLDSVFKDTAMDVSSDISVLQTLLAQEGLTDDDFGKLKKDSFGKQV